MLQLGVSALLLLGSSACFIGSSEHVYLGVPYHAQEDFNWCVPAAIQMWADFDGVTPLPSQAEIWDAVGRGVSAVTPTHRTWIGWAVVALITLPGLEAQARSGWVPVDCQEGKQELEERRERASYGPDRWERFRSAVREAQPGDPTYSPHPFPDTETAVIEDFLYAYFQILNEDPDTVLAAERPTYAALKAGEIRFEILPVENWSSTRCHPRQPFPSFFLVRLFGGDGREVSRGVLHSTGLFSRYGRLTSQAEPLPALSEVRSVLSDRLGLQMQVRDAQYVAADGLPNRCLPEMPCIAFRSGSSIYLLTRGPLLYQIPADGERWGISEYLRRLQGESRRGGLGGREVDQPLVSMGMEGARAKRIAGTIDQE